MKRASQIQIQKEAIVFSSDDSMNSDNSFNSSIEEEEAETDTNTIFHLKEQMAQFFTENPGLQEAIKFEQEEKDEGNTEKNEQNKHKQTLISKSEQQQFVHGWKLLGKDVIRNSQGGQTLPTLETINHRLNIFKQKVDKVDYLEILQRETQQQQQKQEEQVQVKQDTKQQPRSQSENPNKNDNEEQKLEEEQDITYFSFKKKMQLALHKRQQLQREEEERKQKQQKEKQRKVNEADQLANDAPNQQTQNILVGSKMEFQTHVGQMLYQTYLQTGGDKESFKKMAAIFLKNYHKKQKENLDKLKVFPPAIPKFTSEDCKHLNLLLPDFSTQLYAPNKQNLFQGVENYKFPANSPEQEFINLVDQIMSGKVMQFWKEMHQQ
ncbi:unnamed protein product [Paramecium primaurelia]|uniref:Uncharacterized protein n=2 Tax=Paramecium TaxID=5884 RepID=A0A8S1TTR4_9CILI|nr:unnamed protein product [Paramecium primaurelia]CAD8155468.1 unnamed protein product [Paramecium pentaurelia]